MDSARRMAVAALVAAAGLAVQAAQGQSPKAQPPAGLVRQSWAVDGAERTALVAAPRAAAPGTAAPLVLVFHGHGGSSANAARSFRIHEAWPEALVIYPQGLPTVGQVTDPDGVRAGWQHRAGGERDRDLHLVDAMLAWAKARFTIDLTRVFAAGHSNGGSMVYVLWAARSDQFAAFAPSSSVFRREAVATAKPRPAFIVAGREDALVPYAAQQLSLAGVLQLNQAARGDAPWFGGARRHQSDIGADVVTYIHPGGHRLPDDAGDLMVRFFRQVAPWVRKGLSRSDQTDTGRRSDQNWTFFSKP